MKIIVNSAKCALPKRGWSGMGVAEHSEKPDCVWEQKRFKANAGM